MRRTPPKATPFTFDGTKAVCIGKLANNGACIHAHWPIGDFAQRLLTRKGGYAPLSSIEDEGLTVIGFPQRSHH